MECRASFAYIFRRRTACVRERGFEPKTLHACVCVVTVNVVVLYACCATLTYMGEFCTICTRTHALAHDISISVYTDKHTTQNIHTNACHDEAHDDDTVHKFDGIILIFLNTGAFSIRMPFV